eukprot:TRINITY_DN13025_c0_g1_i1.p1 TRINITY_DN13025_c0_g1~~TRINITY_DN13025_c0_g1_i1.p1  ORF type:complete len:275 (+),score=28.32 TRINITY_DN13025_c0_g1_i1:91-825(+)
MARVCKQFRDITYEDSFWQQLCVLRAFLRSGEQIPAGEWRQFYIDCETKFVWETELAGKSRFIACDGTNKCRMAYFGDYSEGGYSVRTTRPVAALGRTYFEVQILMSNVACYYIGVVDDREGAYQTKLTYEDTMGTNSPNDHNNKNNNQAWVWEDSYRTLCHAGDTVKYPRDNDDNAHDRSYCSLDWVGCLVDRLAGTITYYVNGVSRGVAFKDVPLEAELYPCVTMYNGDAYAVIERKPLPRP